MALSPLVIAETASPLGLAGVLLIAGGVYGVGRAPGMSLAAPVKALAANRGVRCMLVATLAYAGTSMLHRPGIDATNALTWGAASYLGAALGLALPVLLSGRASKGSASLSGWVYGVLAGLALAGATLLMFLAFEGGQISYVVAAKRSGMVLSVLAGGLLLREAHLGSRLVGASIVAAGAIVLVFA